MSVLSYLQALSSKLVLSFDENINIAVSLGFLKTNLGRWSHSDEIKALEAFGSYKRETILPRQFDEGSDVDYMIVFKNTNNYDPETYPTWLKKFAETYYSRSEIYKDFPTVVLELGHIKFELVPAIQTLWGTYQIPDNTTHFSKWKSTDPFFSRIRLRKLIKSITTSVLLSGYSYSGTPVTESHSHRINWRRRLPVMLIGDIAST